MSNDNVGTLRLPSAIRPLTNAELNAVSGGLDLTFRWAYGPVGLAVGDQRGSVMNGVRAGVLAELLGH